MIIEHSDILRSILQLGQSDSLITIRSSVRELKDQLEDRAFVQEDIPAPQGEVIRVSRRYLIEELEQIAESQTLERARYYLKRFEKGVTQTRTGRINDINLNRWKEYDDIHTDSLWIVHKRDASGAHSAGYWGNFIPQIPHQMMRRYTKAGEWVVDAFLGSGTTLIESRRLGRNAIGIELQDAVVEKARQLIEAEPNPSGIVTAACHGDATSVSLKSLLRRHGRKSYQLLIMHPPYFDIIRFSDDRRDLSNAASVDHFLDLLMQAVLNLSPLLDRGRYFALVIGDKYAQGEWVPLGFLAMNRIMQLGFSLKSIVVKNFEGTAGKRQQQELWRYRALAGGFYIFKHEYIFIFRKK